MISHHRIGRASLHALCLSIALLGVLSSCGGGGIDSPQAIGSDNDTIELSPPAIAEQDPKPAPVKCNFDAPIGNEIIILSGQSNANEGLFAAINRYMDGLGLDYVSGHQYAGGNEISQWMNASGTPGHLWTRLTTEIDTTLERAKDKDDCIRSFSFVWFQGESDVYPAQRGVYGEKLVKLIEAVESHLSTNWPELPAPKFSIALPHIKTPSLGFGLNLVREAIKTIAVDRDNVSAFETADINRYDHVHLPNESDHGSPEQFAVAQRALACGRVDFSDCQPSESSQ